jgi:dihydroorotate dehydrogenase (fumarate)
MFFRPALDSLLQLADTHPGDRRPLPPENLQFHQSSRSMSDNMSIDLGTTYMGLDLKHPVVASPSPLSATVDGIVRLEDAGAAAVVMLSLFEEQVQHQTDTMERIMGTGEDGFAESLSHFPEHDDYQLDPDSYLETLRQAAERTGIPVIASINGVTNRGWVDIARMMQEAGASGIELNVYYVPAQITLSGRAVEEVYLDVIKAVKGAVSIPVALKMSPYFSSVGDMARQFAEAGADALVLFNRFYRPDFDLENLQVVPNVNLSTPAEVRLPLLWLSLLYGHVKVSMAASHGIHSATEVVKCLFAGADVTMTTSALLQHGVEHLTTLVDGLEQWMQQNEYSSVSQMKGTMSQRLATDPSAFERANYIKMLETYKNNPTPA